jgi:hypothetical protein
MENWKNITEIIDHIVVSLAAFVGGMWVLFRFRRERTDEPALRIEVTQHSNQVGAHHLVGIVVELANTGKTRIVAKSTHSTKGFAYDDGEERLRYSCSLQVRKIQQNVPLPLGHVDWFKNNIIENVSGLASEINILSEYENPAIGNSVDFYMEPGEVYHLEVPITLPAGIYLAKISFVAAGGDGNFWSRIFTFAVPTTQDSKG